MKNAEDNNAQLPEQQENSKVQKKGRRCKIVLLAVLLFFIITGGILTVLASMIFSGPKQIPVQPLRAQDFRLQQKMMRRLAKEVFRNPYNVPSQMIFKSNEIKSLFNLVDFGLTAAKIAGKYRGVDLREFEPVFGNGEITAVCPIDTKQSWLFGGILRLKMTFVPVLADKKLQIELKECHLGKLPLPQKQVQKILDQLLVDVQKSKDFIRFSDVVKEIKLNPDGSWAVTYYPAKLSMYLF